ncbi:MAG: cupredoxin domain-containing protein [Solirubrobacteraceae bacterium]
MRTRTFGVALTSLAVAAAAVPAVGQAAVPTKPKVRILGGTSFVPNRYIKDKLRFNKDVYQVKSGATVTLNNTKTEEPHTLSIAKKSDLPKKVSAFDTCFEGGLCGQLFGAHGFPEDDGPPTTPLVNAGKDGFNTRGDSIVIGPKDTATFQVTADKGRSLYFMCIIHPWMQAKFSVK